MWVPTVKLCRLMLSKALATLIISLLVLSANVTADYGKGFIAYIDDDYETAVREWKALKTECP